MTRIISNKGSRTQHRQPVATDRPESQTSFCELLAGVSVSRGVAGAALQLALLWRGNPLEGCGYEEDSCPLRPATLPADSMFPSSGRGRTVCQHNWWGAMLGSQIFTPVRLPAEDKREKQTWERNVDSVSVGNCVEKPEAFVQNHPVD